MLKELGTCLGLGHRAFAKLTAIQNYSTAKSDLVHVMNIIKRGGSPLAVIAGSRLEGSPATSSAYLSIETGLQMNKPEAPLSQ